MANAESTDVVKDAAFARVLGTESNLIWCTLGIILVGTKLANISSMNQTFSLFISLLSMCIYPKLRGEELDT